MENTINRKDYRRNTSGTECVYRTSKKECEEPSKILSKVINAMLILIFILLLKLCGFDNYYNSIKETFNSGISFEEIKEYVINFFSSTNEEEQAVMIYNIEENNSGDVVEEKSESGEIVYQTAVEGVNQLLEDAEFIKQNYILRAPLIGTLTSEFGNRVNDNPIVSPYHTGIDIAANEGSSIVSAHDGTVIQAGLNGGYGISVTIKSGDLVTLYGHCKSTSVKVGDEVKLGDVIAKVGMTGNATGPHVHFEVWFQDRLINPGDVI